MREIENTVAVIGGLGKMGVVTRRIFEEAGYVTLVSDIEDSKTLPVREAIRRSGIIFFSIFPIENIEDIIRATQDVFSASHLVLDNASLKNPLKRGYELLDYQGLSICSTHPLCKEDQPLFGQNVLIAPFGKRPQDATLVAEQVYQQVGMVLSRIDFDKHDSTMLFNQAFPHLANRAVGHTLAKIGVDIGALMAISTANSKLFSIANWRTLVQTPEMSAKLISDSLQTPEGEKLIQALVDSIRLIEQEGKEIDEQTKQPKKLAKTFREDVASLDPVGELRTRMNEASIIMLQHLANLAKRSFTVETHEADRSGLLHELLGIIADNQINLNTALSEIIEGGFRFHLGVKSGELTPDVIEELKRSGFHIINSADRQS